MEYLIRHLDETDYDDIIRLWGDAGLPYKPHGRDSLDSLRKEFKRKETCYLGMFEGDKMIGVIVGTSDGRKGWINRLAIDPDYRGRGLAGKLIFEAERFLYKFGLKVIAGLIENYNTPSMEAFIKAGYTCGRNILYFSKRETEED
jgi:ribosomal protein S18 acetylase RimI-like enzyme